MNSSFRAIVPYGTWVSPVTPELMTGRNVGLSGLTADGSDLYWLESRPSEAGRTTLIRWNEATGPVDLTPAPRNVGSRVHEYGGGAYAVAAGRIVFSDRDDGSVWLIEDGVTRRIAGVPGCRYADFAFDPIRPRVLAVREDHRGRPPTDPAAAIVSLALSPADPAANDGDVLAFGADFVAAPRLDAAGGRLAWLEWDHPDMPWTATRLKVAALDESGRPGTPALVAGADREAVLQPTWQPGGTLLFASDRSGWWNLYRWDAGAVTAIAPAEVEIGGPSWQFANRYFEPLADGRILCAAVSEGHRRAAMIVGGRLSPLSLGAVAASPLPFEDGIAALLAPPDAPPAIVVAPTPDAAEWRVLRAAGPALLAGDDISHAEAIAFPTNGGATAYGFFYPPASSRFAAPDGTKPPLMVLIHGGPTAMASDAFSLSIQWWTSRGFAVVDVNYRGSTGYGRPYRDALDGAWGVADVEDCIAAVRHLAATGRIDPERVAIRGGSAGGFTVLAALTTSDLFKAGASFYGIGDLMLLAHDTHKFEARYTDRLIGPLPEAEALYRERSPLTHIERLTAPVIFFQGLDDKVVPPNQAETMVAALVRSGVPVAHYAFEGEGHGFRRADTIRRTLELELGFYGKVFGFTPTGDGEAVRFVTAP